MGGVTFSPVLKQSTSSTEAQYLLMAYAFDQLGYRRCEWKCDNLNASSRRAAIRLGYSFEGIFRKYMILKGRTRDIASFAMTRDQWPAQKAAFRAWLASVNFDEQGRQIKKLEDFYGENSIDYET